MHESVYLLGLLGACAYTYLHRKGVGALVNIVLMGNMQQNLTADGRL